MSITEKSRNMIFQKVCKNMNVPGKVTRRDSMSVIIVVALITFVALFMGCTASTVPQATPMSAANATADRILGSLNTGNYTAFSANFSPAMLTGINESSFDILRNGIQSKYGNYVSRDPVPAEKSEQGYNVYAYNCNFEKGNLTMQLAMNTTNIWRVEGLGYK